MNAGPIFWLPNRHQDISTLVEVRTSSPEILEVRTSGCPESTIKMLMMNGKITRAQKPLQLLFSENSRHSGGATG
jgi:hypothetical protein